MDNAMGQKTKHEVLAKVRRQYARAGRTDKRQWLDQAIALFGYHRKADIAVRNSRHQFRASSTDVPDGTRNPKAVEK